MSKKKVVRHIVRTYSAGVHVGIVKSRKGKEVVLTDARRLWRWKGANTINELANSGADSTYTRLSDPVPEIVLTEAIEIVACSPSAAENLAKSRWGA